MQGKINKIFNIELKEQLYNELLNLNQNAKNVSDYALNQIIKYDDVITKLCNQLCISKAFIQSVLLDTIKSLLTESLEKIDKLDGKIKDGNKRSDELQSENFFFVYAWFNFFFVNYPCFQSFFRTIPTS